jgi:hypothetical protein
LPIYVPQGDLIIKRLNIHGFWMYYDEYLPKIRAALTEAAKVVASGKLTLPITTTYKPSKSKKQSRIPSVVARFYWISITQNRTCQTMRDAGTMVNEWMLHFPAFFYSSLPVSVVGPVFRIDVILSHRKSDHLVQRAMSI